MTFWLAAQAAFAEQQTHLKACMVRFHQRPTSSNLHALRVASRRVEAMLFLCQDALPPSQYRNALRLCQKVRARSSKVRNFDVLIEAIESETNKPQIVRQLKRRKRHSKRRLMKALNRWVSQKEFKRESLIQATYLDESARAGCASRLIHLAARFVQKATSGSRKPRQVHHWRISAKRLRYAFEFLQRCGCPIELELVSGRLEQLQTQLGRYTDEQVRRTLMPKSIHNKASSLPSLDELFNLSDIRLVLSRTVEVAAWNA